MFMVFINKRNSLNQGSVAFELMHIDHQSLRDNTINYNILYMMKMKLNNITQTFTIQTTDTINLCVYHLIIICVHQ